MRKLLCVLAAVSVVALITGPAQAAIFTLNDANSQVIIDPDTQSGMHTWTVDGVDQMFQQWFWYRIGDDGPEASIDSLQRTAGVLTDTDGNGSDDTLFTKFSGAGFDITVKYFLTGATAGSGVSDVGETITITSTGGAIAGFHFFQYSDFDLGGQPGNDTVSLSNPNTVLQTGGGTVLSETIISPSASRFELAVFSDTRTSLNDTTATTLDNLGGSRTGDVTWAFQWDFNLAANGTFLISKDKRLGQVPEPSAIVIWSLLGMAGLAFARYRRKR